MKVLSTVEETIRAHGLIEESDVILVALSGGPDSVALLHLLHQLQSRYRLGLVAVYLNHGIRPDAAAKEEKFCAKLCRTLQIPFVVERADIPALAKARKIGLEEAGRWYRYEMFERVAVEQCCTKVALGHHRDDRVETILFRIIRGTGKTGLQGMPAKRGRIVRPLYELTKQELLGYLRQHRLTYCKDLSNESDAFARNFIRNRLLPEIHARLNPRVDQAILNLAETASAEEAELEAEVSRRASRAMTVSAGGKIELDRARFGGYTNWLRRRLLRRCLGSVSGEAMADRATVERLESAIVEGKGGLSLPGNVQAVITAHKVVFVTRPPIHLDSELRLGEAVSLDPIRGSVRARVQAGRGTVTKGRRRSQLVQVDAAKVSLPLVVRSIRAGDRFQPLGMTGRKKVGDYLTDRKVPPVYRDEIPVVADREGIIWVVGYEIADRVKVDRTTRKVVTLEVNISKRARPTTV